VIKLLVICYSLLEAGCWFQRPANGNCLPAIAPPFRNGGGFAAPNPSASLRAAPQTANEISHQDTKAQSFTEKYVIGYSLLVI
jgi:hypothetical protein